MINGLGVVGWGKLAEHVHVHVESSQYCVYQSGVGGIEAEAVMLGQAISMVLPKVVGYKITGKIGPLATSTDVVLTITKVWCTAFLYHTVYTSYNCDSILIAGAHTAHAL